MGNEYTNGAITGRQAVVPRVGGGGGLDRGSGYCFARRMFFPETKSGVLTFGHSDVLGLPGLPSRSCGFCGPWPAAQQQRCTCDVKVPPWRAELEDGLARDRRSRCPEASACQGPVRVGPEVVAGPAVRWKGPSGGSSKGPMQGPRRAYFYYTICVQRNCIFRRNFNVGRLGIWLIWSVLSLILAETGRGK